MKPNLKPLSMMFCMASIFAACDAKKSTEPSSAQIDAPAPTPPTRLSLNDSVVWTTPSEDADTVWLEFAAKDRMTYRFILSVEGAKLSAVGVGSPTGPDGRSASGHQVPGKGDSVWIWESDANQTIRLPLEIKDSVGRIGFRGRAEIEGIPMDEREPESGSATAMAIPFDSLVTRTLTANDTDWLLLPKGDTVAYDLRVTDAKGATIEWLAEDGSKLQGGTLGDSAGGKVHRAQLRPCLSPVVRLRIVSGSAGKGSYTILVRRGNLLPPDRWEPDGSRTESRKATDTLKLDAPDQWRTLSTNDVDYPLLWADSGKIYQIETRSRLNLELELYGPSGTLLAHDGQDRFSEGVIRFLAKSSGYHFLKIWPDRTPDSAVYTVRVRSNPVTFDPADPSDDLLDGARSLTMGQWTEARLPRGDVDWWTAEVSKDTSYVLRLEGDGYCTMRTLWVSDTDKSPTGWGSISRNSDSMWFKPSQSGKMAISLSEANEIGVGYRIQIHPYVPAPDPESPNGTIALAQSVAPAATDSNFGDLTVKDVDYWKVPVDSGKYYEVLLWGPTRVGLEWQDRTGAKLPYGQLITIGYFPMPNATITLSPKFTGMAYLKISKDNSTWVTPATNGPYKFLVRSEDD